MTRGLDVDVYRGKVRFHVIVSTCVGGGHSDGVLLAGQEIGRVHI